jgi:hypothetical protein
VPWRKEGNGGMMLIKKRISVLHFWHLIRLILNSEMAKWQNVKWQSVKFEIVKSKIGDYGTHK